MVDVWVTFIFGVIGYGMRKFGYGLAPMVLGMILGPLCETSLQRAMHISDNDPFVLITRPISGAVLLLAVLSFSYPIIRDYYARKKVRNV
jgi:putative tricarboxylic transport membrane protein